MRDRPNIGKNVDLVSPGPNFGSEPYLITIGDNTTVSFDVAFVTHDAGTRVLRLWTGPERLDRFQMRGFV